MITTVEGLRYGQLVRSIAGRDCGEYYLIVGFEGEKYLLITNGTNHPLKAPKRKNVKHLKITMLVAKEIEESYLQEREVLNKLIKEKITKLKNDLEEGD